MTVSSLKVMCSAPKKGRIVLEAAEAVVALAAKKSAHTVAAVAMVDCERERFAASGYRLRQTANGAHTALSDEKGIVIGACQAVTQKVGLPIVARLRRAIVFLPYDGPDYEVFDTKVLPVFRSGTEVARRHDASVVQPNKTRHWNTPAVVGDAHVALPSNRSSGNGVPIAGNGADSNEVSLRGRLLAPAQSKRFGRIVVEKAARHILGQFHVICLPQVSGVSIHGE